MRANVDVHDRAMRVLQSRSCLFDMPMPGAVCQSHAPDLTGRDSNQGEHKGENGKGGGKVQEAAGKTERGIGTTHDASANGDNGAG